MRHNLLTALSAATAVAALSLSGLFGSRRAEWGSREPDSLDDIPSAPPSDAGPLPSADDLTGVLYKLADPAVKGTDKLLSAGRRHRRRRRDDRRLRRRVARRRICAIDVHGQ